MSEETCAACRFVATDQRGSACRRFPPTTQIVFVPKKDILKGGVVPEEQTRSMFPRVNSTWWCGEWAPKPEHTQ